jgi:hypothetical protein
MMTRISTLLNKLYLEYPRRQMLVHIWLIRFLSVAYLYSFCFLSYHSCLIVKYVPAWLPGAKFKRQAQEWSIFAAAMVDKPLQYVMENLV